ncbi:MAG: glycosyltransferase family 39 protein, partial [Saprospiraceae bacterium]|nr:glycosyltransferase family 39 protein [Saprospiraceae bacterium]
VWATYRFTLLFYGAEKARHAAFMLASCMGLMIISNDVRTDTLLLGFSACAIWQGAEYLVSQRWKNLLGAFFFVGLAMLAKGPIGLVMTAFGLGAHLLIQRQWRTIFQGQWLVGLLVTALVLAPMCWGLWQQFDLHPEKLVNDRHGVSGLRFFFWEQSFGRITGENVWKNDTSGFYFLHVYLWAFLPWCLLLPYAIWKHVRMAWLTAARTAGETGTRTDGVTASHPVSTSASLPGNTKPEFITLGAFLLTFIALSQSQYKLPHYIFITLPWAAVLLASTLERPAKWQWMLMYFIGFLTLILCLTALFFFFPEGAWAVKIPFLCGVVALLWQIWQKPFPDNSGQMVQRGVWLMVMFGFVLNFHFYPRLLPYQCPAQVAKSARAQGIPQEKMFFFQSSSHAMDFYNGRIMPNLGTPDLVRQTASSAGGIFVFTTINGKNILEEAGFGVIERGRYPHFQVALLKPKFLNPATRDETLGAYYLLEIPAQETK